jgi:hypothetical protein
LAGAFLEAYIVQLVGQKMRMEAGNQALYIVAFEEPNKKWD